MPEKPQRTVSGARPLLGARRGWVRKGGHCQGRREGKKEGPFWSTYRVVKVMGFLSQSPWAQNLTLSSPAVCPWTRLNHSEPFSSSSETQVVMKILSVF